MIPDSASKIFPDFRFHKQKCLTSGFRSPYSVTWGKKIKLRFLLSNMARGFENVREIISSSETQEQSVGSVEMA